MAEKFLVVCDDSQKDMRRRNVVVCATRQEAECFIASCVAAQDVIREPMRAFHTEYGKYLAASLKDPNGCRKLKTPPELQKLVDAFPDRDMCFSLEMQAIWWVEPIRSLPPSAPQSPPTGSGELVTPSLLALLANHPDLHALVSARDAFGRQKYGTGLRCDNGRDSVEDANQEIGDLLQYLQQARMEGKDITPLLDMLTRAITVFQEGGK